MEEKLEEIVAELIDKCKENLVQDGYHIPLIFTICENLEGEIEIAVTPIPDEILKGNVKGIFKEEVYPTLIAKDLIPLSTLLIAESFVTALDSASGSFVSKEEALVASWETHEFIESRIFKFTKVGESVFFLDSPQINRKSELLAIEKNANFSCIFYGNI